MCGLSVYNTYAGEKSTYLIAHCGKVVDKTFNRSEDVKWKNMELYPLMALYLVVGKNVNL